MKPEPHQPRNDADTPQEDLRYAEIQEKISTVPAHPGVYLMKDRRNRIIYIGKARNLKKRMPSYFQGIDTKDVKIGVLSKRISSFETIITDTEKEALILESTLIKKYKPRYNVVLKDDKRYPSLRLDLKHPYPNLTIVRKTPRDGSRYFGPFASALAVRQSLKFINKTFRLRKCKNREFTTRTRPCLHYQMDACLGPCCLPVDPKRYQRMVRDVILFLNGRTPALVRKIEKKMRAAAKNEQFEKAAGLRDRMFNLKKTLEKQVAVTTDFKDRDIIAVARSPEFSIIMILFVRGGYLQGMRDIDISQTLSTDQELLGTFMYQYYEKAPFIPGEVIVPETLEDGKAVEEWLGDLRGGKVAVRKPLRGEKTKLALLAEQNARNRLNERIKEMALQKDLMSRLKKRLKTKRLPNRIECFDNSNIAGTSAVSGMVVFERGSPNKSDYRKYKIKTVDEGDDYAYMAEVLRRRYRQGNSLSRLPDLLMVDGGKGQLNIAVAVLRDLGIREEFDVIGIAKKDESRGETQDKIYKPGQANPVHFKGEEDLLLYLQNIRDEAHRFAIGFHRKRRKKRALYSTLDDIPGVGKKRKTILLKHFGGIINIGNASVDEMTALPGMNRTVAETIKRALSP